jgi:hypothetical protein
VSQYVEGVASAKVWPDGTLELYNQHRHRIVSFSLHNVVLWRPAANR